MTSVSNTDVVAITWHPTTREPRQFISIQHCFRWLADLREQADGRWRDVVVWIVHDEDRAVRRYQPYQEQDRLVLKHQSPAGRWEIDADEEHLATRRQRAIATDVEHAVFSAFGDELTVALFTEDQWAQVHPAGAELYVRYGFAPIGHTGDGIVPVCPALIEAQTAGLDDDELELYCVGINLRLLIRGNTVAGDVVAAGGIEHAVDRTLLETHPAAFELMQRVALDAMAG